MLRSRVPLRAIWFVPVLRKVCSTSSSSFPRFSFSLLRSINVATERWEYPAENRNGYDDPPKSRGSSSRVYAQNQNPPNLSVDWNGLPNNGDFGSHSLGAFNNGNTNNIFEHRSVPADRSWGNSGFSCDDSNSFFNGNGTVIGGVYKQGDYNIHQNSEIVSSSPVHDPVQLLDEHCENGKMDEAVELLHELEKQRTTIDVPRLLKLMEACGENKQLEAGRAFHRYIERWHYPLQVKHNNKILEMYGKCGAMEDAFSLFNRMHQRNMTTWDTMIKWLAKNGFGEDAIDLFTKFQQEGLTPDSAMFNNVFFSCAVVGDVAEGLLHLESMKEFNITPSMENYHSVVCMFGNCGYLQEAFDFIEKMPVKPSVDIWETLMKFCRIHGDINLGNRCADIINIAHPCFLDDAAKSGVITAKSMDSIDYKELKHHADDTLLSGRSRVREYRAGDTSHPESYKLYRLLRCLKEQMKEAGYIPELGCVLHDVDAESKEEAVHAHSERLAAANAMLSSPPRSPVRIMKNLRVCIDCHNAMKIISKLVGRVFIMRDAKRFHHVKDGACTCNDYW